MCGPLQKDERAARAAGRLYAADHDTHPFFCCLKLRFGYEFPLALAFIEECRAGMRRLGRPPVGHCECPPDGNPFRS